MAFPGKNYAPPGVYTTTNFDSPQGITIESFKIPVFIGEGNEFLSQRNFELVRGSSSTVDQFVVKEDETGRAVVSISQTGVVTLGSFDGLLDRIQVRNFPIVSGDGTGTTSNSRNDVDVTINGVPVIVKLVSGVNGVITLAQAPVSGDEVRVSYYFNRTDTLITDDVSTQVDPDPATLYGQRGINDLDALGTSVGGSVGADVEVLDFHGDILDSQGNVLVPANNVFSFNADGVEYSIAIPPRSDYTMAQVAASITATHSGTMTASAFLNHYGKSAMLLHADHSLIIRNGSANGLLGFVPNQSDTRVSTFYTYQGPIVDGSNGGVTTTDPAHVTVKVNGIQVIPTSVNGSTRAVTLAVAPVAGATVTIQYYFNTWQDTFDYLGHINVSQVLACGDTQDSASYVEGADFILKDDKLYWGSATSIASGEHTDGAELFDDTQITAMLIDNKHFMFSCTPVSQSQGGVVVSNRKEFQLPDQPTLGNGRNTPLGSSLFQTVSNGRIDLPVNRPDVIDAYWGFDVQDALERGKVSVVKVEGSVITLATPVPAGATVYASYFYNTLVDSEYVLTVTNPGVSGTGTYKIQDSIGNSVYGLTYNTASKGSSLTGVTVEFPSGSELTPDLHYEGMSGTSFTGPVEEIATVQFDSRIATPAKYSVPGPGNYEFVEDHSDKLRIKTHGVDINSAGIDLSSPEYAGGFPASLIGNEIVYTGGDNATVGKTYDITTSEEIFLNADGVDILVRTSEDINAQNITFFESAINEEASGHQGVSVGGSISTLVLQANKAHNVDNHYVGWKVVVGNTGLVTPGQVKTVSSYDGSTGTITVSSDFAEIIPASVPYYIYNPATRAALTGVTKFNGPVDLSGGFTDLTFSFTGSVSGTTLVSTTLGSGPFATSALLAAEIQSKLDTAIAAVVALSAPHNGLGIDCSANVDGQLVFKVQLPGLDSAGYLQAVSDAVPADDFAILAGLDAAVSAGQGQAIVIQGPIAKAYRITDYSGSEPSQFDRLVLRSRLIPGGGSLSSTSGIQNLDKAIIDVQLGNEKAGLVAGKRGIGETRATVKPATAYGHVGFAYGMDASSQPVLKFYDGSGVTPANDKFSFTLDGTPVAVSFTASQNGTDTPLGPISSATSVLGQIVAAMAATPGQPFGDASTIVAAKIIRQEGAGVRFTGVRVDSLSSISIGNSSATGYLGFIPGTVYSRQTVGAKTLASALMANRNTSLSSWLLTMNASSSNNRFAEYALAGVIEDSVGREYLYLQDAPVVKANLGTLSSIGIFDTLNNIDNALTPVTGLSAVSGDGATGEAALDGFFVTSNVPNGSGSANDSIFNAGVGQDGIVGQTYRDKVTGLSFTILPRGWSTSQTGPWLSYPTGSQATLRFNASKSFVTDANIPNNALPGVELLVANTSNVGLNDTATVETFKRTGQEPANGDLYYVTYEYRKESYDTSFFTKLAAIEQAFGTVNPDNPLSLAAYYAILNGAVLIGAKQVLKEEGSEQASLTAYRQAIDELEGTLPGQATPDIITPLRCDSIDLYQYLKQSVILQSSQRYRSERTAIVGVVEGTTPSTVGSWAQALGHTRMRMIYPDSVVISLMDNLGNTKEYLVGGVYAAAGLVGSIVSPSSDVATPWTGRKLVGFTQLVRRLDAVQQNQLATKGVTILEDRTPYLRVRHGLTTDMTNQLTKLPTIIQIADEVQRQARSVLEIFVGIKFLASVLGQIESRLAMLLKGLVKAQIITAYKGIKAAVSPEDPTSCDISAFYSPIFPLLYLSILFSLRSNLS
jgi:hypothetical protein